MRNGKPDAEQQLNWRRLLRCVHSVGGSDEQDNDGEGLRLRTLGSHALGMTVVGHVEWHLREERDVQ